MKSYLLSIIVSEVEDGENYATISQQQDLLDGPIILGRDCRVLMHRFISQVIVKALNALQDSFRDERVCVRPNLSKSVKNGSLAIQIKRTMIFVSTMFFHIGNQPPSL